MNEQNQDYIISWSLLAVFVMCIALYAYCIIDVHKHKSKFASKKATWLNIIWFAPVAGCIIYLINRRRIWRQPNSSF